MEIYLFKIFVSIFIIPGETSHLSNDVQTRQIFVSQYF